MKNLFNIDSTTQFPINGVIMFFAILTLIGCGCYCGWKMKGVVIYMGVVMIIAGLFTIYMGFTDTTL
jgi:hypothetical protein